MRINELEAALAVRSERAGLRFRLGQAANPDALADFEARTTRILPKQVRLFYAHHDGLHVSDPALDIEPIAKLHLDGEELIRFARFDGSHWVALDAAKLNPAEEWSVVNAETRAPVTLTMASFWSNKIMAWIDHRRRVWDEPNSSEPCAP